MPRRLAATNSAQFRGEENVCSLQSLHLPSVVAATVDESMREKIVNQISLSLKIKARDDVRSRRDFVFAVVRQECISFESWIV